mgnify:CR=1 FL=1
MRVGKGTNLVNCKKNIVVLALCTKGRRMSTLIVLGYMLDLG